MRPVPRIPNLALHQAREQQGWTQEELAEHLGTHAFTVSRWERGEARPSPYFRQKLCALFAQSPAALGLLPAPSAQSAYAVLSEPQALPSPAGQRWYVPFPRNPCFTGREALLTQLQTLQCVQPAASPRPADALSGLGTGFRRVILTPAFSVEAWSVLRAAFPSSEGDEQRLLACLDDQQELLLVHTPARPSLAVKGQVLATNRRFVGSTFTITNVTVRTVKA